MSAAPHSRAASAKRDSAVTVVLVHGAWHGAWCFERLLTRLAAKGIGALALDLPGHGDSALPFADLHGDATFVSTALEEIKSPVVLVGHSYGGAVISEAGTHPAVRHLVYLAAGVPSQGQSLRLQTSTILAGIGDGPLAIMAPMDVHERSNGTTVWNRPAAKVAFYDDCDDQTANWALDRLGPQPMENMVQGPSAAAWQEKPSTYIVCTEDRVMIPEMQAILAQRCSNELSLPTSHSPFLSAPELLAQHLSAVCQSVEVVDE
jgi:pimeloyl-ACP methyl ester carboxylesterase